VGLEVGLSTFFFFFFFFLCIAKLLFLPLQYSLQRKKIVTSNLTTTSIFITIMSVSSHHAIPERQANGDSNELTDDLRESVINRGYPGIPYFTPMQSPPAGTATDTEKTIPKLFQPLTVRGVTFQNRIFLSPLCQYSAEYGHHTMWHQTWLGSVAMRGG
jgi:hypothetical protein